MITEEEKERVAKITGERLKLAREKARLSVVQLAELVDCNHNEIKTYEKAVRAPSEARLNSLRVALNIKRWPII